MVLFPTEDKALDDRLAATRKRLNKSDAEHLADDWQHVGDDLRQGLDRYAKEH